MNDGTTEMATADGGDELATVPAGETVPRAAEHVTVPLPAAQARAAEQARVAEQERIRYAAGSAQVKPRATSARDPWIDKTLSDPAVSMPAEPMHYVMGDGAAVGRRRRGGRWLLGALAVLLVAAGVVTYFQFRPGATAPPAQTVRQYFADLASGDTNAALALVDGPAPIGPLLSATALAQPAMRPSHLAVIGTGPITIAGGRSGTAVSVSYRVGGATVHQTITVVPIGTKADTAGVKRSSNQPYQMEAPFVTVTMDAADSRPVTVNGVPYPGGSTGTSAFPGEYVATVAGTPLLAGATARATYDDNAAGTLTAHIALPAPTVASGAKSAVQSAVNTALTACAASTSATPNGCPFRYSDSSAALKWAIAANPTVHIQVGADGVVTFDDSGHAGSVTYEAITTNWFGFHDTHTGTAAFDVTGTATADTSGVAVTFGH